MPPEMNGEIREAYKLGELTEAVRSLQSQFDKFQSHVAKRCTDCVIGSEVEKHDQRITWLERKMYAAIGATGAIVWVLEKVLGK